jgi:hypothetical protein
MERIEDRRAVVMGAWGELAWVLTERIEDCERALDLKQALNSQVRNPHPRAAA